MTEPTAPLSARVADLLEDLAIRIRGLTVDRAAVAITWIAVSLILITAAFMAIFWLLIGIFRILGTLMGDVETAYAVVGLILIIAGAIVWVRRYPQDRESEQETAP